MSKSDKAKKIIAELKPKNSKQSEIEELKECILSAVKRKISQAAIQAQLTQSGYSCSISTLNRAITRWKKNEPEQQPQTTQTTQKEQIEKQTGVNQGIQKDGNQKVVGEFSEKKDAYDDPTI